MDARDPQPPAAPRHEGRGAVVMLTLITLVVLIAAMKAAQVILIPALLAGFLAAIGTPGVFWLERHRVPGAVAVLLVVLAMFGVLALITLLIGTSVNDFSAQLPVYQEHLNAELAKITAWTGVQDQSIADLLKRVDPGFAMKLTAGMLNSLRGVAANAFLILFTTIFILLEVSGFPQKLRAAFGSSYDTSGFLRNFSDTLKSYLAIKTLTSLGTGIIVTIWVSVMGVDFPILWGLVAFLLNYVPNIGSILAAIPAVAIALLEFGAGRALVVAAGYVVVNVVIGSILEPRLMGKELGLSTLVVFLSLVFWGWVLGPVGMLLSVPLTMIAKIALESNENTRWIGILLRSQGSLPEGE